MKVFLDACAKGGDALQPQSQAMAGFTECPSSVSFRMEQLSFLILTVTCGRTLLGIAEELSAASEVPECLAGGLRWPKTYVTAESYWVQHLIHLATSQILAGSFGARPCTCNALDTICRSVATSRCGAAQLPARGPGLLALSTALPNCCMLHVGLPDAQVLLVAKADPFARNVRGLTALDVAKNSRPWRLDLCKGCWTPINNR